MQDRARLAVEKLHGAMTGIETIIRLAGTSEFERRRAIDLLHEAKARIILFMLEHCKGCDRGAPGPSSAQR